MSYELFNKPIIVLLYYNKVQNKEKSENIRNGANRMKTVNNTQ